MSTHEGFPPQEAPVQEQQEQLRPPEFTVDTLNEDVQELLQALSETAEYYNEVRLPGGRMIEAHTDEERALARAQQCVVGFEGKREQLLAKLETHKNTSVRAEYEALGLLEQYLALSRHLEGFLGGKADIATWSRSAKQPLALENANLLIAQLLETMPVNDKSYDEVER